MKKTRLVLLISLLCLALLMCFTKSLQANLKDLKFYHFKNQDLSLKIGLPQTANLNVEYFLSTDVVFNTYFVDKGGDYWGYVQIWNIADLEAFLDQSRQQSAFNYTAYDNKPVEINSKAGFLLEWSAVLDPADGKYISAREYFIRKDAGSQVLRVSVFTPEKTFPARVGEMVDSVLSSVEWN